MTQETAKKADKALNTFKKVTGTFSGSCAFGFVFFLVSSLILHPSSLLYAADLYPGNGSAYGGNPAPVELCPVNTAVSTPSFPANTSYVNMQPNFNWIGPSTGTAVGLASYQLQVSTNDPSFATTLINLSTPAFTSTMTSVGAGAYISTYTLANSTTYYWRVRGRSVIGNDSPWSQVFSFVTDFASPTVSGFMSYNSTSGISGETQWNNLASGVTAQITVQDILSGLAVSTGALIHRGDGHDDPGATSGYGVMYSTNAGASWVDWSTYTATLSGTGESSLFSLAAFNGKLYAGTGANGKIYSSADGLSWTPSMNGIGAIGIYSLAVFNGKLYAGTGNSGVIYSSADGLNWTVALPSIGEQVVRSLSVFNGKLYAGTGPNGKIYSSADGTSWAQVLGGTGETYIYSLAVFNGKLYAGTGANGKIYSSADGSVWTQVMGGTGEISIYSLTVFNGRMYAGTGANGKIYSSADGTAWTQALSGTGEAYINSLAVLNGKLYAGTYSSGMIYSSADGVSWKHIMSGPGEIHIRSLSAFNGRLYAGSGNNGKVFQVSPVAAALTGVDGNLAAQTLTARGLNLVQSTNTQTCNGASPCGATNQVKFTVTDMAGNVRAAGPYAILVDTVAPVAVSTPSFPANTSYVNMQPNFNWIGPSTGTAVGLASYQLQVSTNDPSFATTLINLSTPAFTSTMTSVGAGAYISTYTLANSTTYYWRVRGRSVIGNDSPWSQVFSFVTDFASPTVSGFMSYNSTSGVSGETQWNNLASGVTAQITVQDILSGLAVSPGALIHRGDGHDDPGATSGYGVMYSTNAGASWVDWSTYTATLSGTGEQYIRSLSVFNGKLYAGTSPNGKIYSSADGLSWTPVLSGTGDGVVYSLSTFNGKLYAGTASNGKIYSSTDGSSWTQALSGTGEQYIWSLAVFNGKLYAGTHPNGKIYSSADGSSWAQVLGGTGESAIRSLSEFNGRLYAGTYPDGKIYSSADGSSWTQSMSGIGVDNVQALSVFNGRLYAGTGGAGKIYSSVDGAIWTQVLSGTGEEEIMCLSVFNGKLYAGTYPNNKIYSSVDGLNWALALSGTGESRIYSLSEFNGKLYAGTGPNGKVFQVSPVAAALTGADGILSAQTLTARGLNLVQSTNTQTCNGASPCGATNQVKFTVTDMAGNVRAAGPYAILVDTVAPVAVSTPSFPANTSYVNMQPNFNWIGPSTGTAVGLASYQLQVSTNDPSFATTLINLSTPAFTSTMTSVGAGAYISTYTLANSTTYYWRVRGRSVIGNDSPWSQVFSFVTDFASPTVSGFMSYNSTAGVSGETQWNNLASGVTAQITVQDILSGLAVSSGALIHRGDGHDDPGATSGYGVMYSTNAGASWVDWSTYTATLSGTGEIYVISLSAFNGKVYAGTGSNGKIYSSADGVSWTQVLSGTGETYIHALSVFNGKLYAGTGPNGKIYSSADGSSWTPVMSGTGESNVYSLSAFNGKLYAGTYPNGKIYSSADGLNWNLILSGTGESTIRSLSAFNGKFYAGTNPNGKIYSSSDGSIWTQVLSGTGEGSILSLSTFNGKLYAGTQGNGKIYSSVDGLSWTQILSNTGENNIRSLTAFNGKIYAGTGDNGKIYSSMDGLSWRQVLSGIGETQIYSLSAFNGKLYAGTSSNGKVFQVSPVIGALTGSDGTAAAQTLTARGLNLVQSTNTQTCNGASPCGATNQVKFTVTDMAGNVRAAGPYSVIVDTTPPPVSISLSAVDGALTVVYSTGPDAFSGLPALPYRVEISTASDFSAIKASTNWTADLSSTFTGLAPGTHYARVWARDIAGALNVSSGSISVGGTVYLSVSQSPAPASSMQGQPAPAMAVQLRTSGHTDQWTGIRLTRSGDISDSDVNQLLVYKDSNGDGVFQAGQEPLISQTGVKFTAGVATVTLATPQSVTVALGATYYLAIQPEQEAVVGRQLGINLDVPAAFIFSGNSRVSPPPEFPLVSSGTLITDSASVSSFTAVSLAPANGNRGQLNVPVMKLAVQTDGGTGRIQSIAFTRSGDAADSDLSGIKLWRDANQNGTFEPGTDTPVSSGGDSFTNGVSTVVLTCAQEPATVGAAQVSFFVSADISPGAALGRTFGAFVVSTAAVAFTGTLDSAGFPAGQPASGLTLIQEEGRIIFTGSDVIPAEVYTGGEYAVMKASMTVDAGAHQFYQIKASRTGSSLDSDVSAVKFYKDTGGEIFSPTGDTFLGQGVFDAGGVAAVNITTQTLSAGATQVFFVVYVIAPGAAAGNTIGAQLTNSGFILSASALTSITGNFPAASGLTVVKQTVNTLGLAPVNVAPGSLQQGAQNVPILRLDLWTDRNTLLWQGLSVSRSGAGTDEDISNLRVYRTSVAVSNLMTGGGDVFTAGTANLSFGQSEVITASTQTYLLTASISNNAVPGGALGLLIPASSYFMVNVPHQVSAAPFPVSVPPVSLVQYPNAVAVSSTSLSPSGVNPGQSGVPVMRVGLRADISQALFTRIRITKTGTLPDAKITNVKVYQDSDFNGLLGVSDSLISLSTGVFVSQTAELTLATQTITSAQEKFFFITADISTAAAPGDSFTFSWLTDAYFTVNSPNTISTTSVSGGAMFPFAAAASVINEPASSLLVSAASLAPASVTQGQTNIPFMKLELAMSAYQGRLGSLAVTRTGGGSDADLTNLKLYRDDNASGAFETDGSDTLLTLGNSLLVNGEAVLSFAQETVTVSTRAYFLVCDLSPTAQAGAQVAFNIPSPGAFGILAPDAVSGQNFPLASSAAGIAATRSGLFVSGQNISPASLMQGAARQAMISLTLETTQYALLLSAIKVEKAGSLDDSQIDNIRVYVSTDASGAFSASLPEATQGTHKFISGSAVLDITPQQISAAAKKFFIALDINEYALVGASVGVTVAGTQSFTVSAPNFTVDQGLPVQVYPLVSVTKKPRVLSVSVSNLAAIGVFQGAVSEPFLRLGLSASAATTALDSLKIGKVGDLPDNLVTAVKLYYDTNADGAFTPGTDALAGQGTFSAGSLTMTALNRLIPASTVYYFLTADVAMAASPGYHLGLAINDKTYVGVVSPDSVAAFASASSVVATVKDIKVPSQPAVTLASVFLPSRMKIQFAWESHMATALGGITGAYYAVGTGPGSADVLAWTAVSPADRSVTVTGVNLEDGATYYVSVKTLSDFGFYSDPGSSPGLLTDTVPPYIAGTGSASAEGNSVAVSWPPAVAGRSGIKGYVVEYRTTDSPVWKNIKGGGAVSVSAAGGRVLAAVPAAVGDGDLVTGTSYVAANMPAGTYSYRIWVVNGAGVLSGEPVDVARVLVGALPTASLSAVSAYPNPFDSRKRAVTLVYTMNQNSSVSVIIYDMFGGKVRSLDFNPGAAGGQAGGNSVAWDGADDSGRKVSKGMYLCVVKAAGDSKVLKLGVIH